MLEAFNDDGVDPGSYGAVLTLPQIHLRAEVSTTCGREDEQRMCADSLWSSSWAYKSSLVNQWPLGLGRLLTAGIKLGSHGAVLTSPHIHCSSLRAEVSQSGTGGSPPR
ncbi:unnamed protein product [Pieris brassicae]|uniref:Uncharacterized protein n=1 Tax=Pieris brassicae TaxID=7116 RepID=A0A9P0XGZ8_PIEBR|nr:unnamed protein product [Pieris brassicae]